MLPSIMAIYYMEDISHLATLLRKEGDKILTNKCKLTLPTNLLNELNNLFKSSLENDDNHLVSSFHVLNSANPFNDSNRELGFLHDFFQRSKSLKLTLSPSRDAGLDNIDITIFREIHLLELHRVHVNAIKGLSHLRTKLQHLVCERSLNSLGEVFEKCGGDKAADGRNWCELREAVLNHNGITSIDDSLKYVSMLTTLDLSHNAIEDCDEISGLSNLKYLNLSFNRLHKIPLFSRHICTRLQVLVLRNNFIEDIQSLSKLINLTQLDLLENCIIEHNTLIPLSYLVALQWLNLTGNPLSYHPHHRINTVKFLHSNTLSVRFILDEDVLSSHEQQHVGSLHPKRVYRQDETEEQILETSENLERSIRIKPAIISEHRVEEEEIESVTEPVLMETPKKEPQPMTSKESLSSIPKDYIKSLYGKTGVNAMDLPMEGGSVPSSSTPLQEYISDEIAKMHTDTNNETSNYITASETTEEADEKSGIYDEPEEVEQLSDDDFESGDSNIFLVNVKDGQSDVFVILGKNHLVERNAITSKVMSRISLDSITVCIKAIVDVLEYVYLEFETFRNSNYRYYSIENSEERERFFNRVKSLVENRPVKDALKVFTCLTCSTQFGVEEQHTVHKDKMQCPSCNSNLVFEENNS